MTALARAKYSPERRVRSTSLAFSRSVSAATRAGSMAVSSSVMVMCANATAAGGAVNPAVSQAAARRTLPVAVRGSSAANSTIARVLVRRRLGLDVVLQLARERVGRARGRRGGRRPRGRRCRARRRARRRPRPRRPPGARPARTRPRTARSGSRPRRSRRRARPSKYRKPSSSARDAVARAPRARGRLLAEVARGRTSGRWPGRARARRRRRRAGCPAAAGPSSPGARGSPSGMPGQLAGLRLAVAVADPEAGRLVPGAEHAGVERLARGDEAAQAGDGARLRAAWRSRGTRSAPCRGRPRARARAARAARRGRSGRRAAAPRRRAARAR